MEEEKENEVIQVKELKPYVIATLIQILSGIVLFIVFIVLSAINLNSGWSGSLLNSVTTMIVGLGYIGLAVLFNVVTIIHFFLKVSKLVKEEKLDKLDELKEKTINHKIPFDWFSMGVGIVIFFVSLVLFFVFL